VEELKMSERFEVASEATYRSNRSSSAVSLVSGNVSASGVEH